MEALIDRPVARPLAAWVSEPLLVLVAEICRLTAVPTVEAWLPGLVTVTPVVGSYCGGGASAAGDRPGRRVVLPAAS